MTDRRVRFLAVPLLVLSVFVSVIHIARSPDLVWEFEVVVPTSAPQEAPRVTTVFDYALSDSVAHSPTVTLRPDGFSIMWFDGTRESHKDVVIKQARFTNSDTGWVNSDPEVYLVKEAMSQVTVPRQEILSLGNTIQYGDEQNTTLATIVSIGGWAAASIAMVELNEGGPSDVRKLSLSPFLNRSHLVRSPTIPYSDGSHAIPAYLELGNALGELVRLDKAGRVHDKRRLSQGRFAIQPVIVPFDGQNAAALMRNFDGDTYRLIATWTADGGQVRYPAMSRLADGDILLTYSFGSKHGIKALVFNENWVLGE